MVINYSGSDGMDVIQVRKEHFTGFSQDYYQVIYKNS